MSKSAFSCRGCRFPLAYRHHGGTLHGVEGVPVSINIRRGEEPLVLFTCPRCGEQRRYFDGSIVLRDHTRATSDDAPLNQRSA